jgi:hypothetical protein
MAGPNSGGTPLPAGDKSASATLVEAPDPLGNGIAVPAELSGDTCPVLAVRYQRHCHQPPRSCLS